MILCGPGYKKQKQGRQAFNVMIDAFGDEVNVIHPDEQNVSKPQSGMSGTANLVIPGSSGLHFIQEGVGTILMIEEQAENDGLSIPDYANTLSPKVTKQFSSPGDQNQIQESDRSPKPDGTLILN